MKDYTDATIMMAKELGVNVDEITLILLNLHHEK